MSWLARPLRKLRALFRRTQLDTEMSEEMRVHLELQTQENIAAGMSPEEARYAAQRQFGHIEGIKEQVRDQRGFSWLHDLAQDLRYGLRQLRKAPGFTVVAVLTLAIGIGATTAIFSVVNSVLLRPLPYPEPGRLVALRETSSVNKTPGMATRTAYLHWQDRGSSFSNIAAFRFDTGILGESGNVEPVHINRVTTNYFPTLRVPPVLGRDFLPDEATAGNDHVVVLSHAFWLRKFLGRMDVINQTLRLNDQVFTIIGVLPPNSQLDKTHLFSPQIIAPSDRDSFQPQDVFEVIARLRPDVTLQEASTEMEVLADALAAHFPATRKGISAVVLPLLDDVLARSTYMMSGVGSLLFTLLGAVGFLLIIACVNVANLLLARANNRRKEIALRAALGASRGRIIRQMLCESLMLAFIGGTVGTLLAYWSLGLLKSLASNLPRAAEISLDGHALTVSFLISLITGIGFGLLPALQAMHFNLNDAIKGGAKTHEGRSARRLRSTLIVAEVALAFVLLTGAGLLIHSFIRLQQVDIGFQPEGVYANRLQLTAEKYATPEKQTLFVDQVLQRVTGLPEIEAATFTTGMPIFGGYGAGFTIAGRLDSLPGQMPGGLYAAITPGYFKTVGISLIRGRIFSEHDNIGSPRVAIISESLAKRHFPNQDPLGQRISFSNGPETWREIVGVVGDVKHWGPINAVSGNVYEPFAQNPSHVSLLLAVKATAMASELPVAIRTAIQSIDSDLPLNTMYRLTDGVAASITRFRLSMIIFAFFSGVAVLLAVIGIYGVIAYNITQRTNEIGIRVALGAQHRDIIRLIMGQAGKLIGLGLLIGLAGSLAGSRLLQALLFEVSPYDPVSLVLIVLLLSTVALLACYLPARRATKVDPNIALRCE
jgi:predicted permease